MADRQAADFEREIDDLDRPPAPDRNPPEEEESLFDTKLAEWVTVINAEGLPKKIYLYKFEGVNGETKALVETFFDDCPDMHTIGIRHGSGRYMVIAPARVGKNGKKAGGMSMRFRLGPYYDELSRIERDKRTSMISQGPAAIPAQPLSMAEANAAAFAMIERVIALMMPLIARQPAPQAPQADIAGQVMQFKLINEMMKTNIKDTQAFGRELLSHTLLGGKSPDCDGDGDGEDDYPDQIPPKEPTLLEQFMPLIQQVLPALIGTGPKAAATAAMVRAVPAVQQVIKDKTELKAVIGELDKSIGKTKIDKVLKNLKIERPV